MASQSLAPCQIFGQPPFADRFSLSVPPTLSPPTALYSFGAPFTELTSQPEPVATSSVTAMLILLPAFSLHVRAIVFAVRWLSPGFKFLGWPYKRVYHVWLQMVTRNRLIGGDPRMVDEKRRLVNELHATIAKWKMDVRRSRHERKEEHARDVEHCFPQVDGPRRWAPEGTGV